MLPPSPMLAKINSIRGTFFFLALALLLSGCTPAGPRALLKGKKYLDRGDVTDAVAQFKKATTLLATNATAWNYYGVALRKGYCPFERVHKLVLERAWTCGSCHAEMAPFRASQHRVDPVAQIGACAR